ncbi:GNAT family N-acetyltransferase [Nocardia sp. CDC159]|uniref:GNAT family N-acetyltransferase n=1 Tax=Nocardia pulmonis TaxID=2951408 RepID=A0A9X2E8K3_9NOCA|nr:MULTISPECIES: GNAT family N-acetyltransferase [Nocardia]MCM6775626.1 GNAT family N-acetyltransferase [Nocardia pulmonis]MCM6787640.1 GNAT family N-acetyltransferase [Nocardia sp. CDC159]
MTQDSRAVVEAVLDTAASDERVALLEDRLDEFNRAHNAVIRRMQQLPDQGEEPVQAYLVAEGTVLGGIAGSTWAEWLRIELLWVDERRRGQGHGARLLAEAERIGRERGCAHSRTETWDFQAPEFYLRRGYRIAGEIRDYPPGATEYLLTKAL